MYQITKIGNENENRNIQLVISITSPLGWLVQLQY